MTSGAAVPAAGTGRSSPGLRAIQEASGWYARLCSGEASAQDQEGWMVWLSADPAHRAAWERIEAMQRRIASVPGAVAAPALQASVQAEVRVRRSVLRGVIGLLSAGVLAGAAWQTPLRRSLTADLRTGTGERREVTLADGSRLVLNTRTAVDLKFSDDRRLLRLLGGEILVETAPDPQAMARDFLVETAHGRIRALGTRFLVRADTDATQVTVLDQRVEVRILPDDGRPPVLLGSGQQWRFGATGSDGAVRPADPAADGWRRGSLLADDIPLARLLAELGRYREGHLGCDPAIAGLRVSGAFPVPDTDRALTVLTNGFPLRIEYRTRFWVTVVPR